VKRSNSEPSAAMELAKAYRVDAAIFSHDPVIYFENIIRMFRPSALQEDSLTRCTHELLKDWNTVATPEVLEAERAAILVAKDQTQKSLRDPEHLSLLYEDAEETFRENEAERLGIPLESVALSLSKREELRQEVDQRIDAACKRIMEGAPQ
jgi:hypothetical protein